MKNERAEREKIIIDADEFLISYGQPKLKNDSNPIQTIYNAAKDDIKNLDTLFNDGGVGRTDNFYNVIKGAVVDFYGNDTNVDETTDKLAKEAIQYLGSIKINLTNGKNN